MNMTRLHYADQLSTILRSLRKKRRLTQAQLGELLGLSQARIAELEAKPGVVSMAQMIKVLAALGGALQLTVNDSPLTSEPIPLADFVSLQHGKKGTW